jgi:hypothetical protein
MEAAMIPPEPVGTALHCGTAADSSYYCSYQRLGATRYVDRDRWRVALVAVTSPSRLDLRSFDFLLRQDVARVFICTDVAGSNVFRVRAVAGSGIGALYSGHCGASSRWVGVCCMPSYAFFSLLSPDECLRRMSIEIDPPISFRASRPVYGRLHENAFWIEKRVGYRNSFKTRLAVSLESAQGGGTRITCKAGMPRITLVFMSVWFVMAIVGTILAFATRSNTAPAALTFLLFGAALTALGRYIAGGEEVFLVNYLREILAAREAPEK